VSDTAPKRELVVIEEGNLTSMARSQQFVAEFPFLTALANQTARSGRSCCGGNVARQNAFASAKQTLAGMDSEKKRRLKELLNANKVRVVYTNTSGRRVELTF
jgi:hypothetical protein